MTVPDLVRSRARDLAREQLRVLDPVESDAVDLAIDWSGPIDLPLTDETEVQAACGIMHVHGRARGAPLPLATDYACAVAGVLGAQGVLAALVGRARGGSISGVRTSVGQAALLSVTQYLAAATAPDDDPVPEPASGHTPPFTSADGTRFEIETLDAGSWQRFWHAVDADSHAVRQAWAPFMLRYATATCPLPEELHDALRRLPLRAVLEAGRCSGVSVVEVRTNAGDPVPAWTFSALSPTRTPTPHWPAPRGGPLAGLVVVESTRRVQGPLAGHMLRLLGADVIRIEPPGGDPLRGVPPMSGAVSARFSALNAGKRVVELDLASASGRAQARDLVSDADAFLHNWAPGKAAAWRLDSNDLAAIRPGLVYAWASGWGPDRGPDAPLGTDYLVQAHSGVASAVRPLGVPAAPSLMTLTDVLGGLVSAQGVLAGLLRRERTGQGVRVDSSLLSAAGVLPRTHRPQWSALDYPLRTLNGYLMLSRATAARPVDDLLRSAREVPTEVLVDRLRAHGLSAVAVCTDLRSLAADPRFAAALDRSCHAVPRSPWEFC